MPGSSRARSAAVDLRITTTFDKSSQNAAVEAAQDYTEQAADARGKKASDLHAAIASVEVGSGEVLALYGGPDYVKNSRNWATTARPTASTFKTYALAAGLEDEFSLYSTFNGNTFTPEGDSTPVRNEFSYQYGTVSLLKAATDSINTAFVDLTTQLKGGPDDVIEMAEAAGAPKGAGWDENDRIAFGTAEVSPLNQANAYATFANDGTYVAPHVVKEVTDREGKVLYKAAPEEKKAVSADISRDVTYALSNVVEQGTGSTVRTLDRPVAGKTGTKDVDDDITSAWFVGYTPQISTAVMYVAGDGGTADLDDYARPGDSTFFGGTYPALTWGAYMETAMKDLPVKQFEEPAYVNRDSAPQQTWSARPEPTKTREPTTEAPTSTEPTEEPTQRPTSEQPTQDRRPRSPPRSPPPRTPAASRPTSRRVRVATRTARVMETAADGRRRRVGASDDADSTGASAGTTWADHTRSEASGGTQIIDAAAERGRRGRGLAAEAWLDESDADLPITDGYPTVRGATDSSAPPASGSVVRWVAARTPWAAGGPRSAGRCWSRRSSTWSGCCSG